MSEQLPLEQQGLKASCTLSKTVKPPHSRASMILDTGTWVMAHGFEQKIIRKIMA